MGGSLQHLGAVKKAMRRSVATQRASAQAGTGLVHPLFVPVAAAQHLRHRRIRLLINLRAKHSILLAQKSTTNASWDGDRSMAMAKVTASFSVSPLDNGA